MTPAIRAWSLETSALLAHRGPDGTASVKLLDGNCLLGHNRLSIIDPEGGTQPLSNEDATIWVVFNGEIYNYKELRSDLEKRHVFRTQSDTEVLVHLYEEKGEGMLDDLEGMFAFALVDCRTHTLLLARDRFGEKPLYFAEIPGQGIAFASELKALKNFPGLVLQPDYAALAQFLALGYIPAPRTLYTGLRKLQASESAVSQHGSPLRTQRYWQLNFSGDDTRAEGELLEEFRALFRDSVRLRLRSDVPLGAFLSGGIDSTLVVCAMRELMPEVPLRTYCVGFENPLLDERPYAREVATRISSSHHEIALDMESLQQNLWDLTLHCDEPFADYALLPTHAACMAARKDLKVMLSGDGADELFGGYSSMYRHHDWNSFRRIPGINRVAGLLREVWPQGSPGAGLMEFLASSDFKLLAGIASELLPLQVFRPTVHNAIRSGIGELHERFRGYSQRPWPLSMLEMQATSLGLPEQMLVKVDRASMKAGLESRSPFLDSKLATFAAKLPASVNIRGRYGKVLLRNALPAMLPDSLRWRNKRGFTPPMADWLRGCLKEELLDSLHPDSRLSGIIDPAAMLPFAEAHMKGSADYPDILFRWMVLHRYLAAAA